MPIPLSLIAMCVALLLISTRPKIAKSMLLGAILCLGLTSFNPVANRLIAPLENKFPVFDIHQSVDVVIVLGSSHQNYSNEPAVMLLGRSAIYRLEEGLRILRANPHARLFVSGYGGHAQMMRNAAIELGTNPKRITIFRRPKDTEEEAKAMAPKTLNKRVALVTEASHLQRALGFFDAAGIDAIPAPAFRLSDTHSQWRIGATDNYKSQRAFYEYLGLTWQWIKLKIAN